jgi:hypothetical protein
MQYSKYTASYRRHQTSHHTNESIASARAYVETQRSTVGDGILKVSVETSIYHDVIFQVDPNGTITLIPTPNTVQVSRSFSSARG